ncbi:MAG: metallophosphoesterase [Myxococcales bacterium]|nr:MAG: metallophosphoesterase [Myxococcales bacterium]
MTPEAPLNRPFACIADIHGNLPALEAVLKELAIRGIVDLFVAGDLLLGGSQPLEVWRKLRAINARMVKGPSDEALCQISDPGKGDESDGAENARKIFLETKNP